MRTIIITTVPAAKAGLRPIPVQRVSLELPVVKNEPSPEPPLLLKPAILPIKRELEVAATEAPVTKRQRLAELSAEEKLSRRKMKNRIAAQTARDRKKAREDQMEEAVQRLQAENRNLNSENKTLMEKSSELIAENEALRQELARLRAAVRPDAAFEPAAFINASLQKKWVASVWAPAWILSAVLSYIAGVFRTSSVTSSSRPLGSPSPALRASWAPQVPASLVLALWKATRKKSPPWVLTASWRLA